MLSWKLRSGRAVASTRRSTSDADAPVVPSLPKESGRPGSARTGASLPRPATYWTLISTRRLLRRPCGVVLVAA